MTMQIRGDKIVFPDSTEQTTAFDKEAQLATEAELTDKIDANTTEITNKVEEAPEDGKQYARRNKDWHEVISSDGDHDMTFDITDGFNSQTVLNGDSITFTGRSNEIDTIVSATDTLTIGLPNDVTVQGNITVAGNEINNQAITDWNTAYSWGNHADAGYLTDGGDYVETDPIFTASPAYNISTGNITAWDQAHSWGDHSVENYLKDYTETDPVFTAHVSSSITSGNITDWNQAHSWGNHADAGYLTEVTEYEETDPVFVASPAYNISTGNITDWNTAHSWGNHADSNYLTDYTETDPVFKASVAYNITSGNITAWDQAHSWGNHADSNYLTDYTETNNLTESVTWANVPDSNITLSSVKQHQGNLDIAWSQVNNTPTTLAGYGITDGGGEGWDYDLNGNSIVDTATAGSGTLSLGKEYTHPLGPVYPVVDISGADFHVVRSANEPIGTRVANPGTDGFSVVECRLEAGDPTTNGFALYGRTGPNWPANSWPVDPNGFFLENVGGDIFILAGGGKNVNRPDGQSGDVVFRSKVAATNWEDLLRIQDTGEVHFEYGDVTVGRPSDGSPRPNLTVNNTLVVAKDYKETVSSDLSSSGDWYLTTANGTVQEVSLTGNIQIYAAGQSEIKPGHTLTIVIKDPHNGVLTSDLKWAGARKTLSTTPGVTDIITISNINGTHYASLANGFA